MERLIIDETSVYELDIDCMQKKDICSDTKMKTNVRNNISLRKDKKSSNVKKEPAS